MSHLVANLKPTGALIVKDGHVEMSDAKFLAAVPHSVFQYLNVHLQLCLEFDDAR